MLTDRVRERRVAIWTRSACERPGSLDASIRNAESADVAGVTLYAEAADAVAARGFPVPTI
jgi:hypothetical protein